MMRSKELQVSGRGPDRSPTAAPIGKHTLTEALPDVASSQRGVPHAPKDVPPSGRVHELFGGGSTAVQQKPANLTPVGTYKVTDFGTYWVVPNGTKPADARIGQQGELVTQTQFTALEIIWGKVKDGSGNLLIEEIDEHDTSHPEFRTLTVSRIGMLMSKPKGRELVVGLVGGSKKCTIMPKFGKIKGAAFTAAEGGHDPGAPGLITNGKKGAGDNTFILVDFRADDSSVTVHDATGKDISDPIYIILGHEMIHARHGAAGMIDLSPLDHSPYPYKEEQTTTERGDITENDLRKEHGLKKRHGHHARDLRP